MYKELQMLANYVGKNPFWGAYGTSGNVSIKDKEYIYITRTGVSLCEVQKGDIVKVPVNDVLNTIKKVQSFDFIEKIRFTNKFSSKFHPKPSSEIFFHSILEKEIVIHTHHIGILKMMPWWDAFIKDWQAVIIPYAPIGIELSEKIIAHQQGLFMLLKNHGVVIHGNDISEVMNRFRLLDQYTTYTPTFPTFNLIPHNHGFLLKYDWKNPLTILKKPLLGDFIFECGPEPSLDITSEEQRIFLKKWGINPMIGIDNEYVVILTNDKEKAYKKAQVLVAHDLMWGFIPPLKEEEVLRLIMMLKVLS